MKKLLFILGASMFLFACTQSPTETTTTEEFEVETELVEVDTLTEAVEDSVEVEVAE